MNFNDQRVSAFMAKEGKNHCVCVTFIFFLLLMSFTVEMSQCLKGNAEWQTAQRPPVTVKREASKMSC